MKAAHNFTPRLMTSARAAHYLGISESKLRELAIPRRELDAKRLYDVTDLDAFADGLPTEGHVVENGW